MKDETRSLLRPSSFKFANVWNQTLSRRYINHPRYYGDSKSPCRIYWEYSQHWLLWVGLTCCGIADFGEAVLAIGFVYLHLLRCLSHLEALGLDVWITSVIVWRRIFRSTRKRELSGHCFCLSVVCWHAFFCSLAPTDEPLPLCMSWDVRHPAHAYATCSVRGLFIDLLLEWRTPQLNRRLFRERQD